MTTQLQIVQNDFPLDSQFVSSVSLQDDYLVFGSWLNSTDEDELNSVTGAGAVFIKARTGDTWGSEIKVVSGSRGVNRYFGLKVASGGDWVVTAEYLRRRLHIINRNTGVITVNQEMEANAIVQAGWDIACNNDCTVIVVGVPHYQTGEVFDGRAKVYSWNGTSLTLLANLNSGVAGSKEFGYQVAISGDGNTIAVGSKEEDLRGQVRVFSKGAVWDDRSYTTGQLLEADTPAVNNYFGAAPGQFGAQADVFCGSPLALNNDGSLLIIGAYGDDSGGSGFGAVYVYKGTGTMTLSQRIDGSVANNMFGYSVALNPAGNRIVIGEQEYDVSGDNDEGAFNLYGIDGALIEQRLADTPLVDDFLGYAASITANYIAVVATEHDGDGTDQGAVYMFGYGGPSISSIEKPIDYFIWETEARRIDQFRIKKERRHE